MKRKSVMFFQALFGILLCGVLFHANASAMTKETEEKAKQIWQMLDYLAVDYGGAVKDGAVLNKEEYAEMQEFSRNTEQHIRDLPDTTAKPQLIEAARAVQKLILEKAAPSIVAERSRGLANALLAAYPVPVSPAKLPDLQHGARLYQAQCAACHGATGRGDGPLAAKLTPPPVAFTDHERAQGRSIFSLYQTTSRGVAGTAMPSFSAMPDADRWALAFYISTLSYSEADRQRGAQLWAENKSIHDTVNSLSALTQASEVTLTKQAQPANARSILAFLRSHPDAVGASAVNGLGLVKSKLRESLAALEKGDKASASRLAISAYLDGFEPVEPALAAKNKTLFEEIEKAMGAYRAAATEGRLENARDLESRLQSLVADAEQTLHANASEPLSTFLGALTILLREGIEALLIVVAMVAFLKKAGRADVLPYIHAGWITALVAGSLTWGVATYIVDMSGASRELTEGFAAIFAAVVLIAVGVWMHQKSLAGRWQAYIKEKLSHALGKSSVAVLFLLSFVTVYREVFETILFYAALWNEGNSLYLLAGLLTGAAILAVVAVIFFRTSAKLPISQFFAVSSALVAVLAVVLIGKGMAALQEAGVLNMTPVSLPRIDVLGIYPTQQTLIAQVFVLLILFGSFAFNRRSLRKTTI